MKKKLCVLTMVTVAALTGCSHGPDLSRLDNSLAAQYVADALLRNDKNYDESLDYDHSLLQATPTPAPTPVPTPVPSDTEKDGSSKKTTPGQEGAKPSETVESVSMSEIYGISGIKIQAGTYRTMSSYGSDFAVCTAKKGNKLVVVNFTVTNTTKKKKQVNLAKEKMQVELLSGDESLGSPLLSIVDGDLQYFNAKMDGGKTKQGVLIFEVSKSAKVNNVKVRFAKESKEAVVSVR